MTALPDATAAASLILVCDRPDQAPELLMAERARHLAFAGGAFVFPGGRVDPGDRHLAQAMGGDVEEVAARIAAVRESIEEAGVVAGIAALPPPSIAMVRARLHAGAPLDAALAGTGATLALDTLVPFARWCPAEGVSRRFDTRFFLARASHGLTATADGTETARLAWTSAAAALADGARLIFPTRRLLERLAQFADFDAAVADAARRPPRAVVPWTEDRGGVPYLCIPADLGYPVDAEPLDRAKRG